METVICPPDPESKKEQELSEKFGNQKIISLADLKKKTLERE
jgi:hypothetical protein